MTATEVQRLAATVLLQGADLSEAHLEESELLGAHLEGGSLEALHAEGAELFRAHLQGAFLSKASFHNANLAEASLEKADLSDACLQGANLFGAHLEKAYLTGAHLEHVDLHEAHLEKAYLSEAHLEHANLSEAHAEEAYFSEVHLEGADLSGTHLDGTYLNAAHLEGVILYKAHLERAFLYKAHLEGATLSTTKTPEGPMRVFLGGRHRHIGPWLADTQWGSVNLAVVDWSDVDMLGDEYEAQLQTRAGKTKTNAMRLQEYEAAVRANRQLAVALQAQGLNEEAARFAYRAQVLQRIVLRRQRSWGQYLFSAFLDLLAGYGYRPERSLLAYLIVIFGFMVLYLINSHVVGPPLTWDEALVLSVTCFHGRGFLLPNVALGATYARLAAVEAVVGLLIEVSFIATFTQRFFSK
jgi:uncharacterized protein YjbI with pentapeptide repeats